MEIEEIVPESAPFSEAQRSWLNGFLSGWLDADARPAVATPDDEVSTEDYPWHDDTMPLEQRMALAEGRALDEKLMAAMGQQDCGQCGYLCDSYARALAKGAESDPNLCVPGGRETRIVLKDLMSTHADEIGADGGTVPGEATAAIVGTRNNPVSARVLAVTPLTESGSCKAICHVTLDLGNTGLTYRAGDSLGVYSSNDPALVELVLHQLRLTGNELMVGSGGPITTREALLRAQDISRPSDELLELLLTHSSGAESEALQAAVDTGVEEGVDVLDLLQAYSTPSVDPIALINSLASLQPRLYSISSSPGLHAPEVHATIAVVKYARTGRERLGVASTFIAERCKVGHTLPVYIQPTADFLLPEDPSADIIMIGPGTGIAPFRAFLHERAIQGATGKNWLFFGNPNEETDFLYKEELLELKSNGVLNELHLAFSRDQSEKIYVQHRLLEQAEQVWSWLESGAYIFLCGDANRMAVDVHQALTRVIKEQGKKTEAEATQYLQDLKQQQRYLRDVY